MIQLGFMLDLMEHIDVNHWNKAVFSLVRRLGFEHLLYGLVPNKHTSLDEAFLCSNYPSEWRERYLEEKLYYADPAVTHCLDSNVPLVWDGGMFRTSEQKKLYHESCRYGIRSGITFPIHGADGEFGLISYVSDTVANKKLQYDMNLLMPVLGLVRDYVFESSKKFIQPIEEKEVHLTGRELETLRWAMEGKTTWEISKIICCSEATVNFHLSNVRRKFQVSTRQQAVVKAIRLGLISTS